MSEDNSTWTATCAASSLEAANGSGLPPNIDLTVRVAQVAFTVFLALLELVLNGLVVVLIVAINSVAGRWIMGLPYCIANGFLSFMLYYIRASLILIFSLDRFASVFVPFHYPKYRKRVVTVLCMLFWGFSFLNSLIMIPPFLDCYNYIESLVSCYNSPSCSSHCEIFNYTLAAYVALVTILPAIFFTALFIKGRKIRRQVTNLTGENTGMTREDWRAIKTFILLLLPSFLQATVALSPLYRRSSLPFAAKNLLGKIVGNTASLVVLVDPIIILRNADVKAVLKTMIERIKGYYKK